jgi:hypothetical protein
MATMYKNKPTRAGFVKRLTHRPELDRPAPPRPKTKRKAKPAPDPTVLLKASRANAWAFGFAGSGPSMTAGADLGDLLANPTPGDARRRPRPHRPRRCRTAAPLPSTRPPTRTCSWPWPTSPPERRSWPYAALERWGAKTRARELVGEAPRIGRLESSVTVLAGQVKALAAPKVKTAHRGAQGRIESVTEEPA